MSHTTSQDIDSSETVTLVCPFVTATYPSPSLALSIETSVLPHLDTSVSMSITSAYVQEKKINSPVNCKLFVSYCKSNRGNHTNDKQTACASFFTCFSLVEHTFVLTPHIKHKACHEKETQHFKHTATECSLSVMQVLLMNTHTNK